MSNFLLAFLGSVSLSTWFYTKQLRRSGGNTSSALISSAGIGVIIFVILLTIFSNAL